MPCFTGPVKPMASSTRSVSMVNSVPGKASSAAETRTACSCLTLPCSSPVNFTVCTLQSRVPPSSCEVYMRNCIGHNGQGVDGDRVSGGLGRSEEHTSELQSLRHLVCRL